MSDFRVTFVSLCFTCDLVENRKVQTREKAGRRKKRKVRNVAIEDSYLYWRNTRVSSDANGPMGTRTFHSPQQDWVSPIKDPSNPSKLTLYTALPPVLPLSLFLSSHYPVFLLLLYIRKRDAYTRK